MKAGFFDYCYINELELPDNDTYIIRNKAFSSLTSYYSMINNLVINDETRFEEEAFSNTRLANLTVNHDVTSLIYKNSYYINHLVIGEGVKSVCDNAFYRRILKSLVLPSTLETIGVASFAGSSIESLVIPGAIKNISKDAFYNVTSMINLTIEEGVETIGEYAFYYCRGIKSLTLPSTLKSIDANAFKDNELETVINKSSNLTITKDKDKNGGVGGCASIIINGNLSDYLYTTDGLTFLLESATKATLYSYNGTNKDLVLPDSFTVSGGMYDGVTYETYSINSSALFGNEIIETLVIPSSVDTIGGYAFAECSKLKTITIDSNVKSFGKYAFRNCNSITDVYFNCSLSASSYAFYHSGAENSTLHIGNKVTKLSDYVFYGSYFSNIIFEEDSTLKTIDYSVFQYSKFTEIILPNSVKSIGRYAFSNCSELINAYIPDSVTTIGDHLFAENKKLQTCYLSQNIKTIPGSSFYSCPALESITMNAERINEQAFYACYKLTNIDLKEGLTYIGKEAFSYSGLETLTIPSTVTLISEGAFRGIKSKFIDLSKCINLTVLSDYTFYRCNNLEEIILPTSLEQISYYCFGGCGVLKNVVINSKTLTIGESAFVECVELETFNNEKAVITEIGACAFNGCKKLTTINLPLGLITVDNAAFKNCSSLEALILPQTVTTVGTNLSTGLTSLKKLYLPNSITTIATTELTLPALEELFLGKECASITVTASNIKKVYISSESIATELIYDEACNNLIVNADEIYLLTSLTVTDYITYNYELKDTIEIYGESYYKYVRNL